MDILHGSIPVPIKGKVFAGMVMVTKKCTCGIPVKNPKYHALYQLFILAVETLVNECAIGKVCTKYGKHWTKAQCTCSVVMSGRVGWAARSEQ